MSAPVARPPPGFDPPRWVAHAVEPTVLAPPDTTTDDRHIIDVGARGSYVIGRVDTADIVVSHSSISRHHCALAHHIDGRVYIIDLQSACGTKIDGRRIEPHKPAEEQLDKLSQCLRAVEALHAKALEAYAAAVRAAPTSEVAHLRLGSVQARLAGYPYP